MTSSMEDISTSQDAKTLVPLSLSLVAKKEKILQMEAAKLEKVLFRRHEILRDLREGHEHLLTTNGQLQARRCLYREKLVSLKTLLGATPGADEVNKGRVSDAVGMNELDATAEKCELLKEILLGLVEKHTGLERRCMKLEEQTSREILSLNVKKELLNEAQNTLHLISEDIRSSQWNLEYDQAALAKEDKRLSIVSQSEQYEAATVEKVDAALRCEKSAVEDLRRCWQNYEGMIHEEHRQLAMENEDAISEQRKLQILLGSNGATCPADEEVVQSANDLKKRLQHVNEEMANAKLVKRELAIRNKREVQWLSFTHSSIKAKDEQLSWLECQRAHLENEQNDLKKAYANEEATYQAFLEEHKAAVTLCENQLNDAERQLKATDRAISAQKKKTTAISKKVTQKAKVLAEWKTKISTSQEQMVKCAATQKLVNAEMLAVQSALEQASLNVERTQQLRSAQDMESEELRLFCAVLESEIQQIQKTLVTLKNDIAATQTAVKNRTDEIRDKFLSTFVVEDAKVLIELLNKEIANWTTNDIDKVDSDAIASKTKMLKQRYDDQLIDMRKRYNKILRQKKRHYNDKLKMLNAQIAEKNENLAAVPLTCNYQGTGKKATMKRSDCKDRLPGLAALGHQPEVDYSSAMAPTEDNNDTKNQELDTLGKERPSNDDTTSKVPVCAQSSSNLAQQKATEMQKLAAKSARRQLAPGLNLVDESLQTDKKLTDIFTTESVALSVVASRKATDPSELTMSRQPRRNSGGGTRQPRLKRRTPAQKAGHTAKTASITPEAGLPANIAGSISSTQSNPAVGISSQSSYDSPVGDDDVGTLHLATDAGSANETNQTADTEVFLTASQVAAKKPQLQKAGQYSNAVKRRTSTKVMHRSRQPKVKKVNRVSIGRSQANTRTVDWSATDSFTFD